MLKLLGWLFLYYLKSTVDSRSDSAQGIKERVNMIPPKVEKGEDVRDSGFSPFVPCINCCIGASPIEEKDNDSTATAGSDFRPN